MAKKKTLKEASAEKQSPPLAESLAGSANEIWLAGLGAFAKAQSEGKKIYEKLIEQGKDFEQAFKSQSQKTSKDIKSTVNTKVDSAKKKAAESWDKLENVFETRVEKSLHRLGVPTNKELDKLVKRIEQLTEQVSHLTAKQPRAKTTETSKAKTPKKAVPKKTAVKKVSTKKSSDETKAATTPKPAADGNKNTTKKTAKKATKKTTKKTSTKSS